MKIKCPANPNHDEFVVSVRVAQDWKVDGNGNFLECINDCTDVYQYPNSNDYYTCSICGETAVVK